MCPLFLIYSKLYFLDSTISLIPVLSSPSTSTSANAGIHIKSTPAGATKPLAIAIDLSKNKKFLATKAYEPTDTPTMAIPFSAQKKDAAIDFIKYLYE